MDWLDISVPIRPGIPIFEGDPSVEIERVVSIPKGGICNVSRLDMGAHTGTHVDAPVHFIEGGAGVETVSLEACIGPAWVVDATAQKGTMTAQDVDGFEIPAGETRILFKTPNSALWDLPHFSGAFIGLDAGAAAALVAREVALVGIDYLSIAPFGNPAPTHRGLLEARTVILEGLDLRRVEPGPYDLVCLPLKLVGCDGGPARALLRPRGR